MTTPRDMPVRLPPGEEREAAKLIYDTIYLPGEEVDGDIMPPFSEAEEEEMGGYLRAVEAARLLLWQIRRG